MCHTSCQPMVFQSTLPVWGGTADALNWAGKVSVSIHPPRVGRDTIWRRFGGKACEVSIHPPRVGRDRPASPPPATTNLFQSTLPVWGGTAKVHKNSL